MQGANDSDIWLERNQRNRLRGIESALHAGGNPIRIPRLGLAFASSAAGKLLGFFRIQAIAVALGASAAADALLLALTMLALFDVVFVSGAAILTAQAVYVRRHAKNSEQLALAGLARSAALWTWLGLTFGLICAVFGAQLSRFIAPGFSAEARAIFASCCALGCFLPAGSALMVFASALNRINGREVLYTFNPIVINVVSLAAILAANYVHIPAIRIVQWFLLSVVASTFFMFAYQVMCLETRQRQRLAAHFVRAIKPRGLITRARQHLRELRLVGPIIGALLIQQVITLISYSFATRAGPGFLLLFGLAERLTSVIFAVFVMTFLTVLEPRWARASHIDGGGKDIADDIAVICAALIPLTAVLLFAGDSLARLLFGHGAVRPEDVEQLATITRIYGLSLPGLSLGVVFARLLIIRNRGSGILWVNVAVTILHLALCFAGFKQFGALAIAASLVISLTVQAALYAWTGVLPDSRRASVETSLIVKMALLAIAVCGGSFATSTLFDSPIQRLMAVAAIATAMTIVGASLLRLRLLDSIRRLVSL